MKKILIMAANPAATSRLRLEQEIRDVEEALWRSRFRDQFKVEIRVAVRPIDIQRALLDIEPQIVHFCGHGEGQAGLVLEDVTGAPKLVSAQALSSLFKLFADSLECVLLNACYSEVQANAIVQHINYVIGMTQEIRDDAAIAFAVGFYDGLGDGKSVESAYDLGCVAIQKAIYGNKTGNRQFIVVDDMDNEIPTIEEHLKPVLKQKKQN